MPIDTSRGFVFGRLSLPERGKSDHSHFFASAGLMPLAEISSMAMEIDSVSFDSGLYFALQFTTTVF